MNLFLKHDVERIQLSEQTKEAGIALYAAQI